MAQILNFGLPAPINVQVQGLNTHANLDQKKPHQALALKLFLLIGAVSLIVMAVYGLITRSATTENLQRQAKENQACPPAGYFRKRRTR